MEVSFPFIFALAGKSSRLSGGEVLAFWEDKIELLHRGELLQSWEYKDMEKLLFKSRKGGGGFLSFMLGSMGRSYEDEWEITVEGNKYQFLLEIDSKYRKQELSHLCAFLGKHFDMFEAETKH